MSQPCVLDIKICDVGLDDEAVAHINKKYKGTTLIEHGFLITGMQYYQNDVQVFHTKYEVYKLDVDQTRESLRKFFNSEETRSAIVDIAIERIGELLENLRNTSDYRFYSSSLLFVYDARNEMSARANLIDFGRVTHVEGTGPDDISITNIENFLTFIDQLNS